MWIIGRTGFVSVVQDHGDDAMLVVRARVRSDLDGLLAYVTEASGGVIAPVVHDSTDSDYRYRTAVPRAYVVGWVASEVRAINYTTGVKDECIAAGAARDDEDTSNVRATVLYRVWSALADLQPTRPWATRGGVRR